jgi:hypothetical protein
MRGGALDFLAFSRPHPGSKTHVFAPIWGDAKKKEHFSVFTTFKEIVETLSIPEFFRSNSFPKGLASCEAFFWGMPPYFLAP